MPKNPCCLFNAAGNVFSLVQFPHFKSPVHLYGAINTHKTRGGASDIENEALNYDRPIHDTNMNASINVASVLFLFTIVNPCTSYRVHHVANLLDEETFYPHIKRTIDSQAHNTIVKLKTHHFGIEPSE
jgi:hypothetical protein